MPAHITHEIFVSEVFEKAFGGRVIRAIGFEDTAPYRVFGAQGADFCLHNHRTKPTALIFGKLLHSEGYGRFVGHLIAYAKEREEPFDSPFGVFIAAFSTHAVLDRFTHPFINYHSGWVTPFDPRSEKYRNCHVFYERIIDVFVLRIRTGVSVEGYDFYSHVDCGETMPAILSDSITEAVMKTYPDYTDRERIHRQIENAYYDTRRYFLFTNPPSRESVLAAYLEEHSAAKPPGKLPALLHPTKLPDLDFLNFSKQQWNHPGKPQEARTESFFDLYEQAIDAAVPVVQAVADAFSGSISCEDAAAIVGNENLSDGESKKAIRKLKFIKPLPLQEVLRKIYFAE